MLSNPYEFQAESLKIKDPDLRILMGELPNLELKDQIRNLLCATEANSTNEIMLIILKEPEQLSALALELEKQNSLLWSRQKTIVKALTVLLAQYELNPDLVTACIGLQFGIRRKLIESNPEAQEIMLNACTVLIDSTEVKNENKKELIDQVACWFCELTVNKASQEISNWENLLIANANVDVFIAIRDELLKRARNDNRSGASHLFSFLESAINQEKYSLAVKKIIKPLTDESVLGLEIIKAEIPNTHLAKCIIIAASSFITFCFLHEAMPGFFAPTSVNLKAGVAVFIGLVLYAKPYFQTMKLLRQLSPGEQELLETCSNLLKN